MCDIAFALCGLIPLAFDCIPYAEGLAFACGNCNQSSGTINISNPVCFRLVCCIAVYLLITTQFSVFLLGPLNSKRLQKKTSVNRELNIVAHERASTIFCWCMMYCSQRIVLICTDHSGVHFNHFIHQRTTCFFPGFLCPLSSVISRIVIVGNSSLEKFLGIIQDVRSLTHPHDSTKLR